jgi:hypothetical protein
LITGVIRYQDGTLVVELPCGAYELAEHLGSIGIRSPASEILAHGTEQVEVKLAAGEPIGAFILANLRDSDTLSGVNLACQEVNRVCPFGYDEFLDMQGPNPQAGFNRYAFYKPYETLPPSTAEGMKFILEESRRYHSTMENYRTVCEAEAAEDDRNIREVNRMLESGEDEWER